MHVCIFMRLYVCIHTYIHTYIHTCIYIVLTKYSVRGGDLAKNYGGCMIIMLSSLPCMHMLTCLCSHTWRTYI